MSIDFYYKLFLRAFADLCEHRIKFTILRHSISSETDTNGFQFFIDHIFSWALADSVFHQAKTQKYLCDNMPIK